MSDERDNMDNFSETPNVQDVNKLIKVRRDKLSELQKAGKDPFVHVKYDVDCHAGDIHADFSGYEGKNVTLGGRIMTKRNMGKASFIDVQDKSGRIQVYVKRDIIGDEVYEDFEKYDIGDIVGVKGEVFKTQKGEISVKASECILLAKSLQPLPEKWHGLKDQELRYRQRYVDLIVNPDVKDVFIKRSAIIRSIRNTLDARGFMEVETPVLQPIAGGANARPFITHHNTLDMQMYLRIALELYLKRLIVGGLEKVYEIGRVFRNEGVSIKHNPEFTMLELYEAFTDYHGMMELCEDVISKACIAVNGTTKVNYQGTEIDFKGPFKRMTMVDAVKEYAGIDFTNVTDLNEARKIAKEKGIEYEERDGVGNILSYLFEEFAEEHLIQPTFVIDHPWEISPLTKRKPGSEHLTERFELFVLGRELANAYSELNDPIDQRQRFMHQESLREQGDDEANEMDEDFLLSVEYGMPPTGGIGIGIDRLVMFLTNAASIRDILLFPTMRKL